MALHKPNTDITVRGGMINFPAAQIPTPLPRHQPNTPQTKKTTTVRPDHQTPPAKPALAPKPETPTQKPEPTNEVPEELE